MSTRARVWVVSHAEVFLYPDGHRVDESVTFIASSKTKALRLIRRTWVEPGTWWRLDRGRLDDLEGCRSGLLLHSRRGGRLRSAPVQQGYRAAILRYRRNLRRTEEHLKKERRKGAPKKTLRNIQQAILWIRRCLAAHPVR